MPALPLTPEQLADAARLKGLFEQWKVRRKDEGQPSSQMVLGHLLEMNQSAISQYLNGGIPLNTAVAAKFAKVFGCQIDDFSPVLAKEAMGIGEAVTSLMGEGAGQRSPGGSVSVAVGGRQGNLYFQVQIARRGAGDAPALEPQLAACARMCWHGDFHGACRGRDFNARPQRRLPRAEVKRLVHIAFLGPPAGIGA